MNENTKIEIIDSFVVLYKPEFYMYLIVGRNWDKTTYSLGHLALRDYVRNKGLNFTGRLNDLFKNGTLIMDFTYSRELIGLERKMMFFEFTGGTREAMTNWKLLEDRNVKFRLIKRPTTELKESLTKLLGVLGVKE